MKKTHPLIKDQVDPKVFPKYTPNPIFIGLPDYLKDPANFNKIQRALLECLATTHTHSEMQQWAKCISCQSKVREHKLMMKKLGFQSPQQYLAWKKTMGIIESGKKVIYPKYND